MLRELLQCTVPAKTNMASGASCRTSYSQELASFMDNVSHSKEDETARSDTVQPRQNDDIGKKTCAVPT